MGITSRRCPCLARARHAQRGFTLIELMIVLLIASVLAAIAVPSFQSAVANQKAKAFAQDLYLSLSQARAEAIKSNGRCVVSVVPDDAAKWHTGWKVEATGADCAGAPYDVAAHGAVGGLEDISQATITYDRRGRPSAAVNLTVCDVKGYAHERTVSVGLTGAPQVDVDYSGTCTP